MDQTTVKIILISTALENSSSHNYFQRTLKSKKIIIFIARLSLKLSSAARKEKFLGWIPLRMCVSTCKIYDYVLGSFFFRLGFFRSFFSVGEILVSEETSNL